MSALTIRERSALAAIALLTALAGVANYGAWAAVPRFAIATLALAGLAWVVSFATEQLGDRFGPAVTGMLQSTLGNLPELFVVIFALQKGELVVAQTAIVGSILANALLVLGLVIVVGARRSNDGIMRFHKKLPRDTATLLQVTVFIIVLLGLSLAVTLTLLLVAGSASAFVSDWFINGLKPAIVQLHISQAFAGLVIVAIAGNAVENTAGLVLSYKGRPDLAISVVKNSVAQIAAFLFPLLVLVSFALRTTLTFSLAPVYIGALLLSTLALAQVTGDGDAAEFEGWALVALYVILGALTLYE